MLRLPRQEENGFWHRWKGYFYAAGACLLALCFAGHSISATTVTISGLFCVSVLSVYWTVRRRMTVSRMISLLIVAGFVLRLGYILYTGVDVRQHDVERFGGGIGHSGYIEFLYQNGTLLPQDPTTVWQFYHPPLHHALAACLLRVMTAVGCDYAVAVEGIQYLTLFYSTVCMLLCRRLFGLLGLHGKGKALAMVLICFHPTFIIMAGSINNDILSVTFLLGAAVSTLRWWKQPTFRRIIPIALCIGFGMMTKLSAVLIAPAVAVLFLWKWLALRSPSSLKHPIRQFGGFAALCCPLGLWWSVRNLWLFGTPPTYVPMLSQDSWLYIGNYSVWERLFHWFNYPVQSVFLSYGLTEPILDYNPMIALLKTAVFGEYTLTAWREDILPAATVLFWTGALVAAVSMIAMVWIWIRDKAMQSAYKVFTAVLYGTILFAYLQFCLVYQHGCTQNARYAVPLIVLGAFFVGRFFAFYKGRASGALRIALCLLCTTFAVSSAFVYTLLGVSL